MKRTPTVLDAKKLANDFACSFGVIIIAIDADTIASSSFGHTRASCDALRRVLDQIVAKIESGEIEP